MNTIKQISINLLKNNIRYRNICIDSKQSTLKLFNIYGDDKTNNEKTVHELFKKYHPNDSVADITPDNNFNDHYIVADSFKGLVSTKCFNNCEYINEHKIEEILAMKIHSSVGKCNSLKTDQEIAEFLYDIIN